MLIGRSPKVCGGEKVNYADDCVAVIYAAMSIFPIGGEPYEFARDAIVGDHSQESGILYSKNLLCFFCRNVPIRNSIKFLRKSLEKGECLFPVPENNSGARHGLTNKFIFYFMSV